MISIYAFCLFLWICLAVQAPTQGGLRKITKAKRVDLGKKFKLIVEFESDSPVPALWEKYHDGQNVNLKGPKLENGKTTLKLAKTENGAGLVFLRLGHRPSHFVSLWWNLGGDGDITSAGEFPLAVITPGLDLPNGPGQKLEVKVAVEEGRGLDHMNFSESIPNVFGKYWDEDSNRTVDIDVTNSRGRETCLGSFCPGNLESHESRNGTTTSTFTFQAGPEGPIEGYYQGQFSAMADRRKMPVWQMIEYFTLVLHKKGEEIPFPYDLN